MTFDALGISASGLTTHRKWLDAISDNIANINTVVSGDDAAFAERFVEVQADRGQLGVTATAARYGETEGRLVHEPNNPLANADGYVRYPDIDLGEQMAHLISAQRGFEANAAVVDRAKSSYEAALQIGRN